MLRAYKEKSEFPGFRIKRLIEILQELRKQGLAVPDDNVLFTFLGRRDQAGLHRILELALETKNERGAA